MNYFVNQSSFTSDKFVLKANNFYKAYIKKVDLDLHLFDRTFINLYIKDDFKIRYKKLVELVAIILKDEFNTSEDYKLAEDEINRLKSVLYIDYKKNINPEVFELMISKIEFLEKELSKKISNDIKDAFLKAKKM